MVVNQSFVSVVKAEESIYGTVNLAIKLELISDLFCSQICYTATIVIQT